MSYYLGFIYGIIGIELSTKDANEREFFYPFGRCN